MKGNYYKTKHKGYRFDCYACKVVGYGLTVFSNQNKIPMLSNDGIIKHWNMRKSIITDKLTYKYYMHISKLVLEEDLILIE